MDKGREENYWPAFVDALSNVVLTLVFVLVIFVFALTMAANKVERKMQEVTEAEAAQKTETVQHENVAQENVQLREKLAIVTAEVEKLRAQSAQNPSSKPATGTNNETSVSAENVDKHITIEEKPDLKPLRGETQIQKGTNSITLSYPLSVSEMDEKSTAELGHVVDAMEKNTSKHKILLRSSIGQETYSVARRLAYYRALSARNILITQGKESPSNITTIIVQPSKPEDGGRVEILFQKP
jgi:hypothetical protein